MRVFAPFLLCALTLTSFGCASPGVPGDAGVPGDGGAFACAGYQELLDGECRDVQVLELQSRELAFSRDDGYELHGTLVLPVTEGEYLPPVFVLVHGSGPNDRDETARGSLGVGYGQDVPTFGLLAEGLARAGAAVYRYDKRTCFRENSAGRCPNPIDSYPGDLQAILVDDYLADLRAAVRAVAAEPDVDGSQVTVVGHSQGANFVPPVVADEPGVVAGIQLAGASLPIDRVITEQLREYADDLERRGGNAKDVATLRAEADRFETALAEIRDGSYPAEELDWTPVGHWRNWMDLTDHLREDFLAVDRPMLLLNGDFDFNVRVSHLERFRGWAIEAGKENATFEVVPGATHSFVELEGGGTRIGSLFSEAALETIVAWHKASVARPPAVP